MKNFRIRLVPILVLLVTGMLSACAGTNTVNTSEKESTGKETVEETIASAEDPETTSSEAVITQSAATTPEQLVENYFQAVYQKDYEAIWNMVPERIRKYAVDNGIIDNEKDGLDFIQFAVNDYYWLKKLNLPDKNHYDIEITRISPAEEMGINEDSKLWKEYRILDVNGVGVVVTCDDGTEVEGSFFLVRIGDNWYLTSVVGDDELFDY